MGELVRLYNVKRMSKYSLSCLGYARFQHIMAYYWYGSIVLYINSGNIKRACLLCKLGGNNNDDGLPLSRTNSRKLFFPQRHESHI